MEKEDKRMAWFPAPYLEKLEDDDDDEDEDELDGTCESRCRDTVSVYSCLLHT